MVKKGAFAHLAVPGAEFQVRVTPRASRNDVIEAGDGLRVFTTTVPENGKANREVAKLLARAFGVAKTRLTLVRGQTARDKTFRID